MNNFDIEFEKVKDSKGKIGCVSSAQHQSVKDKALKTNLKKYGHVSTEVGNIINLEQYNNYDIRLRFRLL